MFEAFGKTVSKIFNDPELKEKAREFCKSATQSAETFGSRFRDEDIRAKFRDVGEAAQDFSKSIAAHFREDKENK